MVQRMKSVGKLVLVTSVVSLALASLSQTRAQAAPATADVAPPETSLSLVGMWTAKWTVGGQDLVAGLLFKDDGTCGMVLLDTHERVVYRGTGRYTFQAGVLSIAINERRIVESVRWIGSDQFVFASEQANPWLRISSTE